MVCSKAPLNGAVLEQASKCLSVTYSVGQTGWQIGPQSTFMRTRPAAHPDPFDIRRPQASEAAETGRKCSQQACNGANGRAQTPILSFVCNEVPADIQVQGKADAYTLLEQWDDDLARSREMHPGTCVVGRLKPGVTQVQAQLEMNGITALLAEAYPSFLVGSIRRQVDFRRQRPTLPFSLSVAGMNTMRGCIVPLGSPDG